MCHRHLLAGIDTREVVTRAQAGEAPNRSSAAESRSAPGRPRALVSRVIGSVLAGLAAAVLVACSVADSTQPAASGGEFWEPIATAVSIDPETCQRTIRGDISAAQRIRAYVNVMGLSTSLADARAAAGDPTSAIDIGIPLSRDERALIARSGQSFPGNAPLLLWAHVGAPDRFGGVWIDPPGSGHWVVAIVGGAADTVLLAQCLQVLRGLPTRYVRADLSYAEGEALQRRVLADRPGWAQRGLTIISCSFAEELGLVEVGVEQGFESAETILRGSYGPQVVVTPIRGH